MSTYRIDGVFIAHEGDKEMNVTLLVEDGTVTIGTFGDTPDRIIHAPEPAALAFVDTPAAELLGTASTSESRN
jgi:hypothetical protein